MPHPLAFKPHAEAEEYAKNLSANIEGKNGELNQLVAAGIIDLDSDACAVVPVTHSTCYWRYFEVHGC